MKLWRSITLLCSGLLCALALAVRPVPAGADSPAETEPPETLVLKSGDELSGKSLGFAEGELRWKLPDGGIVTIAVGRIARLSVSDSMEEDSAKAAEKTKKTPPPKKEAKVDPRVKPAADSKPAEAAEAADAEPPAVLAEPLPITDAWYQAARSTYTFSTAQASEWTKRFELGGSWVEGNSNTTTAYVGGVFERQFERVFHQLEWNGRHSTADDEVTQSRWQFNGMTDLSRYEGANWILFATHRHLFDQLADLDYRGTYAGGIGYKFFDEGDKRLTFRVGPGMTLEKYDPPVDDRVTFDAFSQVEARWPLFDRTRIEYESTFTPSIMDVSVFRVVSKYDLLVALDDSESWAMKIGLRHYYNSKPNPGLKKHDFTTTFSVVYSRQ